MSKVRIALLVFLLHSPFVGCVTEEVTGPVTGSILIDTSPDEISAPWTLEGPDAVSIEGEGDALLEDRQPGRYTLTFGEVEGYATPATQTITLGKRENKKVDGKFVAKTRSWGTIVIDPDPDGLNAPWVLESAEGQRQTGAGDLTLSRLDVGDYTLTWGDVPGYATPRPRTATLVSEAELVLSDVYEAQTVVRTPRLPLQSEWTDHGVILGAGQPGDWDFYLWGGFAASPVKRNGTYLLYYQGADGYDDIEETVTRRSIGVATSANGIDFVKHGSGPVLTWLPSGSIEEGATSGGAWTEPDGTVHFYYGANTALSTSLVTADARLASSPDGLTFADAGRVLDHASSSVWGWGDELFPVVGFREGSTWFTYYIPNGTAQKGQLGVAWGADRRSLSNSARVVAAGASVPAWGPSGWARLSASSIAVFVSAIPDGHATSKHVDVYTVDPAAPSTFTGPVRSYSFTNMAQATVLLDEEAGRWFLYYRTQDASAYGVRTAPIVFE